MSSRRSVRRSWHDLFGFDVTHSAASSASLPNPAEPQGTPGTHRRPSEVKKGAKPKNPPRSQSPSGPKNLPGNSQMCKKRKPAPTRERVETDDGFLLSLQHIPHGKNGVEDNTGPPVFLQHGLFQGGDTWFINSPEQSLGYILADNGFDVWIGNVRGTRWSKGHSTYSVHDKLFWDWSWQELAEYDLLAMLSYVYTVTQSKILYGGHSQGTIMDLAALTMPEVVKMITSAALLCPISYLSHVSAGFVLRAVAMHLDQMLVTMGIH